MTNPLINALSQKPILVADGGTGTEVERISKMVNYDLWSSDAVLHHPEVIHQIHTSFLEAGADIITTATYQGNPAFLKQKKVGNDDLITPAVQIAKQARADFLKQHPEHQTPILIAGSVGPYGAYLNDGSEYTGNYHRSTEEYQLFHAPHLKLLAEAGVDFFAFETNPNFAEIKALVQLNEQQFPKLSSWVTISVNDQFDLADGTPLKTVVDFLNQSNSVAAIGVNCTDINNITPILQKLNPLTKKPLVVYPNNGDRYDLTTRRWVNGQDKITFTEGTKEWLQNGAAVVGGCCRTTPDDIKAIAKVVKQN